MAAETAVQEPETGQQPIPAYLIHETLNGKPLYRKGYKDVLAKRKTPGEIMGCSDLQAIIVSTLFFYLSTVANRKLYWVVTNEPGLHIGPGDNLANDIAFYEKDKISVKGKFFSVAPKVAIEVDIKIDPEGSPASGLDYVHQKTQAMFDFGTERVIWIITESCQVIMATKGENWLTCDWSQTIPVLDGITMNVAAVLTEEGVL
ncbi:MAG: Uma2 family endonuclease [Bacteroidetes bacterium]|nr:Uma2 family endonuclease [Fibrella sp.]